MTTKISGTSAGYISPNDLGYVGLPREAVLDNIPSPAEQRAFAMIASLPFFIPAALFSLAGCGSPGEAEDPTLIFRGPTDGHGDVGKDGGTTDEGDVFIPIDNGSDSIIADSGDALSAADDGGMSVPDDGMTLVDADLDGKTDTGLDATPDDSPDAIVDGASDANSPAEDVDALIASDDGGMSEPDDGMTLVDADSDGKTDTGFDVIADVTKDTAPPISLFCKPEVDPCVCIEGSTNVPCNFIAKGATKFVCDGLGTSKVSVDLDPNTQTTQSITVDKCVKDILFGGCQVINGDFSELCGAMKIVSKPKPGPAPTVKNPTLTQHFPSGDGCFKTGNSYTASWSASTYNNNPLLCTATLKDTLTNKDVASVQVSQAPSNTMSADLPIANGNILPFRDYALAVFCEDSTGQKGSATSDAILTYYKETLLFYRFLDGAGAKVTDSGPLKLDGTMVGNPQWVVGGGLYFDGQTRIITPKPSIFTSLNEASLLVTFKPTVPQINEYSVLTSIANSTKQDIWALQIAYYAYPQFLQVINNAKATFLKSPNTITADTSYSLMGTHQSGVGTNLKQWDGSKWQTIGNKQDYLGPFVSGNSGDVLIGGWNDGSYGYIGEISKVIVVGKNIDICN